MISEIKGNWICPAEYAHIKPKNVFHRQLEKIEIKNEIPQNLHILYRKKISYNGGKTVLRVSADDYYKLYINGEFVTCGPAAGFDFCYYYNTVDISKYLVKGENQIAFHTYYQGLINRVWVSGDDRLGLIFDITEDEKLIAKSDESVKCAVHNGFSACGVVGYDTQFMEDYNSNSEYDGFWQINYDDAFWDNAKVCEFADYKLMPQKVKQLDFETVYPKLLDSGDGYAVYDFESIYAGYLNLTAKGSKGDKVTLLFAQELENGEVRYELRANCVYKESWTLSGKTDRLDEFDYKSFRYVKIICPSECEICDVSMLIRHYPFKTDRRCELSDEKCQKIWDLCVNTLKYGTQESIMDCIEREKGQYLGDGSFTSTAFAVLTGDTSIMERLIDETINSAFINPGFVTCAPCSYMQEIAEYTLMLPQLLLSHYAVKKDKAYLKNCYDSVVKMLDYYRTSYEQADELLYDLDKWCVVDWPQNARDGYDFDLSEGKIAKGTHNAINAYYIGAINHTNKIAKIIGAKEYRDTKPLTDSYIKAFFDTDNKLFCDTKESKHHSLASNALALRFDLCPDKETEKNIVDMIMSKDAESSAFFITFASLLGLIRVGEFEKVKQLLTDDGRWLRMIDEGATVTFEAWGKDVKWNTSLFHLCYSYAVLFMTDWDIEKIY